MSTWLFEQFHPLRPGFWLLLSALSSSILFAVEVRWLRQRDQIMRILRWVFVPYLGLIVGGLSPRLMGLSDIDWVAGLGLGLALIFALWLILILVRITLHLDEGDTAQGTSPSVSGGIIYAGAQELHWVFLRAASWEILMAMPNPPQVPGYWAIWIASLLALPEIWLQSQSLSQRLVDVAILTMTAILFFYTRNFWLCWLLHISAQGILGQRPAPRPERKHSVR